MSTAASNTALSAGRGPRRFARLRDRCAYELGITGEEQATRRFFRAAFYARLIVLAATPFFFILPGPQYEGGLREWAALGILGAWLAVLAVRTSTNDEWMKRTTWIYVVDIAVAFGAFLLMTHSQHDTFGGIVIVGAFQLQTYGPTFTAGALTGVPGGATAGLASAVVYLGCLAAIDHGFGNVFDHTHVQGTIFRCLLYVISGATFGLYNSLVGRLRHELRLAESVRAESEAFGVVHHRGLNKLDVIGIAMGRILDGDADPTREQLGKLRRCVGLTATSLRQAFDRDSGAVTAVSAAAIVNEVSALLALNDDHPIGVSITEPAEPFLLEQRKAKALEEIVTEAISNALKYASDGTVHVHAHPFDGKYAIRVTDAGPDLEAAESKSGNSGHGLIESERIAREHAWELTQDISDDPGHGSLVVLVISRESLAQ